MTTNRGIRTRDRSGRRTSMVSRAVRRAASAFLAVLTLVLWPAVAQGADEASGAKRDKHKEGPTAPAHWTLAEGQTHKGDKYIFTGRVEIAGTQEGDLSAFSESVTVTPTGKVTGDTNAGAREITIDGTTGDSVRAFGSEVTVNGTINGDLLAFAGVVTIGPKGHVTGDVGAYAGKIEIEGSVGGDLDAKGGQVVLSGSVGGDADLEADMIEIDPKARIAGSLDYVSRNRLDLEGKGIVGGDVTFEPKEEDEKAEEGEEPGVGHAAKWFWWTSAALVSGLVALAVARKASPAISAAVGGDPLRSAGVGFIAVIVVPVAAALSCILIITIPLAILVLLIYLVALYLAKMPVALWIGQKVLRRLRGTEPSPYWALATGILILYLLFPLPYLGKILWFATLFLGAGALILGLKAHKEARQGGIPVPPPAMSGPPAVAGSPGMAV